MTVGRDVHNEEQVKREAGYILNFLEKEGGTVRIEWGRPEAFMEGTNKALIDRTLAKVNEMVKALEGTTVADCEKPVLPIIANLYQIKHELESMGTRPSIILEADKHKRR